MLVRSASVCDKTSKASKAAGLNEAALRTWPCLTLIRARSGPKSEHPSASAMTISPSTKVLGGRATPGGLAPVSAVQYGIDDANARVGGRHERCDRGDLRRDRRAVVRLVPYPRVRTVEPV